MLILFLLGLGVGLTSTFLGAGGGILVVPILLIISPLTVHEVVATAQATVLLVVTLNTFIFRKTVNTPLKLSLLLSSGTAVGAFLAARLNLGSHEKEVAVGLICILLALSALLISQARHWIKRENKFFEKMGSSARLILFLTLALMAGASGGFTGIGAGLIMTALLSLLPWVDTAHVVPMANICMMFSTLASVVGFSLTPGTIHWEKSLVIFAGAIITGLWGASKQHLFSAKIRQYVLSVILLLLSVQIFTRFFA